MLMQTSAAATALISAWEGFKPQAYLDTLPNPPVWTIGKGTTKYSNGDPVSPGDEVTENEADEELYWFVRKEIEPAGGHHFQGVKMQPGMRDALASLMYNLINGTNPDKSFPKTKALILAGAPVHEILDEWVNAIKSGGKPVLGLHRRRTCEALVVLGWPWNMAYDATRAIPFEKTWRMISGYTPKAEPDPEIFEELEIPVRGREKGADPTPEDGKITMDDAQFLSAEAAGYDGTYEEFMGHRTVVTARNAIKAPNIDPKRAPKPMEDSKTHRGLAKKTAGKENLNVGAILSGTATTAATVKALSRDVSATVESTSPVIAGFTYNHFILIGLMIGIPFLIYGAWKMYRGEEIAKEGRAEGVQPKV